MLFHNSFHEVNSVGSMKIIWKIFGSYKYLTYLCIIIRR
nr:MAG TPA: hypothetical protein [Crassvirales sp.]